MANPNAPHGFVPIRMKDGASCISTSRYTVAAGNSAIGVGDLVVIDATGTITGRSGASPAAGTVVGVAAEPKAASAGGTMLVWDSPNIIFEGQGTTATISNVGNNADITDSAPVNGVSQQSLSGYAVTAGLVFKVLRVYPVVGNAYGANNRLEVCLNKGMIVSGGDGPTGI